MEIRIFLRLLIPSDFNLGIHVRETGQVNMFFSADASGFWAFPGCQLVGPVISAIALSVSSTIFGILADNASGVSSFCLILLSRLIQ